MILIGCDGDTVITLSEFDILEFTATANSVDCSEEELLGSIDVEITLGMVPFVIEWSSQDTSGSVQTNAASHTILNLPNGTYTIVVTDAEGCTRDTMVTINNTSTIDFDIEVIDITCEDSTGMIVITNITGTPEWTVTYDGPGIETTTLTSEIDSVKINDLMEGGNYSITVTDANGCPKDTTVMLGGPNELLVSVDQVNMVCCELGSMKLTYDCGFGPATGVLVYPDGTMEEVNLANLGDMVTFPDLFDGAYELELTDEAGSAYSQLIVITQEVTEREITITASSLTVLPDGTVDVNVTVDPPGDYIYTWDVVDPEFINDPTSPNPTLAPCKTRTYTVTVSAADCVLDVDPCLATASITIEVPPVCIEPYIYIPNAFAPNGNNRNELFRIRSSI